MIYFYQSISPHRIERLQSYLDFFFINLFAGKCATYDHSILIEKNFKKIVNEYPSQIDNKLRAIYNAYNRLNKEEKLLVQEAYNNNNNIRGICSGLIKPYKYTEIPVKIRKSLKSFYDALWESVLGYARVVDKCGTLKEHFKKFRRKNTNSVCPFCGLDGLLNEYDDLKNAYDHYIPQKKYPFCSVQFVNLFPICDQCNKSGNKGQKDILYSSTKKTQRPLYYPYTVSHGHKIVVRIDSTTTNLRSIKRWQLVVDCNPATDKAKKEAWLDIYNIERRYKARIAKDSYKWKDKIIKDYNAKSKRTGFNINDFISDKIDDYSDIENEKDAIVKKCFFEFYLKHPSFKKSIKGSV